MSNHFHPINRRQALAGLGSVGFAALFAACGRSGSSSDNAASGSTGTTAALLDRAGSCAVVPELTEGPYYIDVEKVRSDIREDRQGTSLTLALRRHRQLLRVRVGRLRRPAAGRGRWTGRRRARREQPDRHEAVSAGLADHRRRWDRPVRHDLSRLVPRPDRRRHLRQGQPAHPDQERRRLPRRRQPRCQDGVSSEGFPRFVGGAAECSPRSSG